MLESIARPAPSLRDIIQAAFDLGGEDFAAAARRMSPERALAAVRKRAGVDARPRLITRDSRTGLVEGVTRL